MKHPDVSGICDVAKAGAEEVVINKGEECMQTVLDQSGKNKLKKQN